MFGNLVRVDSPILIDRYNRALNALIGRQTTLAEFHIDISGYSPEVGDEFGDPLYLNHQGVNRQFILLTTEQETAPLLEAKFSTSRGILKQFIAENRPQLFALTARDAVTGEMVNSVYDLNDATALFDIKRIEIEADTTGGTLATARVLREKIEAFKTQDDAWFDDVLIAEMIELAKQTGDVTRNPVALPAMSFTQDNFWTSHFGGLYVFRGVEHPAAIAVGDVAALGELPIAYTFEIGNRRAIAKFLELNDLVDPIVERRGSASAEILRDKMDMITASVAAENGENVIGANTRQLRTLARRYAKDMPKEWHGLAAMVRWAEDNGSWPRINADHPAYFYTLRASEHADVELVNMLLAELTPMDPRQLFICHKDAFYAAYATWPDEKRSYVVDFLHRAYQIDKEATRETLFGHEKRAEQIAPVKRDRIRAVGPWGAVRRGG